MKYSYIEAAQKKIQKDINDAKAFEVKVISFTVGFIVAFPATVYLCCKIFG